jgi:hypothetical protein
MSPTRPLRRVAVLCGVAALAATLAAPAPTPPSEVNEQLVSAAPPTNAGKIYRWGNAEWSDGFTEPLARPWVASRPRQVNNQFGMLTINGTAAAHNVGATYTGHARRYGRWETRIWSEQNTSGRTPYRVVAELIPAGGRKYHCGAQNIVLASYDMNTGRAHMAIRTLPNVEFSYSKRRDLGPPRKWHTYAVEVTRRHVSWFVDARVVMTERRKAARSGIMYALRLRLVADQGARMNPGRMQMDWVRHYTLKRPNARSIKAPMARRGTYGGAC